MPLSLRGPTGQAQDIEAVIDTGYSGFLTLPTAVVTELGLPFAYIGRALLANDVEVTFDVHDVTVLWDGQPRRIRADATGSTPLVGMLLLDQHMGEAPTDPRLESNRNSHEVQDHAT